MKVKSIELINLKSYEHSIIEFSENINLLIGANNSGKSTIIKSLLNLQYRTFDKKDIRATKTYSKTYIKIIGVTEKDNESFYFPQHHKEYERGKEFTIAWGVANGTQPEENLYYNSVLPAKRIENNRIKLSDNKGNNVELKSFPRFSDSEDKNNFIYPFLSKRKTEHYDSNSNQEQTFKVSDTLRNLGAKILKIGNATHPQNEEFIRLCDDILGFRIGVIPAEQNGGNEPGIYVTDTSLISIRSMGDGVANIVGFIVILLTENNKLFLIEELENDIHPKALKKLLNLIIEKSINNQFVISTHSHIVIKHLGIVPKSKIFFIDWEAFTNIKNRRQNIPTSTVTETKNDPVERIKILEKLGYDFHDFDLYEAYLILEESSAERVIRDFLIPNFVPELYNKIKTIAAKGVSDLKPRVQDFNRLFVFIHTNPVYYRKAWVFADGDVAGMDCLAELKSQFSKWPEKHFVNFSKSNFEEYYPSKFKKEAERISKLSHDHKRAPKEQLLNEVMLWSFTNRELAIKEFEKSAEEVIKLLKSVSSQLSKK